ncbi:MAG: hypothetical protein ABI758_04120 [Candidatus Woesebacteria bacterium]
MSSSTRGFGSMNEEKRRKIAKMGGIAAHKKGTAHEFSSKEARIAGHAGGVVSGKVRKKPKKPVESRKDTSGVV